MSLWIFMDVSQTLLTLEMQETQTSFLFLAQACLFMHISSEKIYFWCILIPCWEGERGNLKVQLCLFQWDVVLICGNIYFSSCAVAISISLVVLRWNGILCKNKFYIYIFCSMRPHSQMCAHPDVRMLCQRLVEAELYNESLKGDVDHATPLLYPHRRTPLSMATA